MIPELLKEVKRIQIITRRKVDSVFAGGYRSSFRGTGMEFEEVRGYSPGDDVRSIDWKVTARSGRPHIKVYREERELSIVLAVDVSGSQSFGSGAKTKARVAAEVSALLAFAAQQSGDKVGLLLCSDRVERYLPPRKGRGHAFRLVRELLGCSPASARTDLVPGLEHLLRVLKRKATVFLISDLRAEGYQAPLRMLAARHDLVVLRTADRRERTWEDCGLVFLEDPESGAVELVDTGSARVRRALEEQARAREQGWTHELRRARVDSAVLDPEGDLATALHRLFQRREKRLSR